MTSQTYDNSKFSQTQIEELRSRYDAIQTVDPAGKAYAGIRSFLDGLDQTALQMLADAQIKWISRLAINRIVG